MLNFLFGENIHYEQMYGRHQPETGDDSHPIFRLCSAILETAATHQVTKIRFVSDPDRGELQLPPTQEMHEAELERQRQFNDPTTTSYRFRQIMTEAGVVHPPESRDDPRLCVDFLVNGNWRESMSIPTSLKDTVIRRYQFHFNYKNCVSLEIPENLIYVNRHDCSITR